ncbi:MAG: amidohydrolase family protein [Bacteroidales bacterium]|nr:amidohydrolase family protein [Bacteroidales bacterium]
MSLLIKNGKLVLPSHIVEADLLIKNGKINRIDSCIEISNIPILDAKGAYVLPAGIDPHVHLLLSTANGLSADDFETGSKAALAGGTTTIIDFITPTKGQHLLEAYQQRLSEVKNCYCDFAFHMSIIEWRESIPEEMEACIKEFGITSFKTYLAYQKTIGISFVTLEKVMIAAKNLNAMVTIHSEMGDLIDKLREEAIGLNQIDLNFHPKTRPDYTEYQAVDKIIELVRKTNCKTYIVHVSTAESLNKIKQAQKEYLPIFAESCPQYFTFNESVYTKIRNEALGFMMSPPLRSEENRKGIENAIIQGTVSTLGTDHCPFTLNQKQKAKNFAEVPNGAGGVQHRLSLFYSRFVHTKKLLTTDMAKLTSSNPAQFFRLPQKGEIKVDYDADLIIWKEQSITIKDQLLYSQSDIDIYANEQIKGKVDIVIKAGEIVYQNGKLEDTLPLGHYLYRK